MRECQAIHGTRTRSAALASGASPFPTITITLGGEYWRGLLVIGVILAAGRGTRMGSLTGTTPKPLLPISGRPIIEHILSGLRSAGVEEITVVTGYRGDQIEAHLGNGAHLGLRLAYRRQHVPEGTARALLLARDFIGDRNFILSWGDIVVEPSVYREVLREFERVPCDALLTVNAVEDPWRGAAVYVDPDWRVTDLVEKPPRGTSRTSWNNAGIFVLAPTIFTYAAGVRPSARGEHELPQAIATMIADGRRLRAYPLRGFWSDVGTPEDLAVVERALTGSKKGP